MSGSSVRGVVVGLDASADAQLALDWAAAEAALRDIPLRLVHAASLAPFQVARVDRDTVAQAAAKAAEELLGRAESRVREQYGTLRVETKVLSEEAVPGLIRVSEHADLLVVGSRGLNQFTSVLIGSVSQALVAHAPCPVVVFRADPRPADGGPRSGGAAEATAGADAVVVGVGYGKTHAPVAFAFAEAARRAVPVVAIRGWEYPPDYFGGYAMLAPDDAEQRNQEEAAELVQALAKARAAHPQVRVRQEVGLGNPATALVDASARACLVVLGVDRHRRHLALPVGAVAQRVLHHSHCPVAVVPHGHH
jgi:nucleotide-binding universal stress UspA family protein